MGRIVASECAGAVDEADHQFTVRLQNTMCLGQHGGGIIHEADGGHAQDVVEAMMLETQRFGDPLNHCDASFFRIVQHLACRVDAHPHAKRSGEASGADTDGQSQPAPGQQRTDRQQLGLIGRRVADEPGIVALVMRLERCCFWHGWSISHME